MTQGKVVSDWSAVGKFRSRLVGFNRAGTLYDPLIHGETVGTIVGSATFIPGKGIKLDNGQSYVKYLLPETISAGEFSMEVEGLMANAPGNKAKVFGMQEGQGDFITNRYRVDIQYRGTTGVPPNAIQWRVLYGSSTDHDVRYEPDTAKRFASVYLLDPGTTYYWKATWGGDFQTHSPTRRHHRIAALRLWCADAARQLQSEPALRLSWRSSRSERNGVGLDRRDHLSQRLVESRSASRVARQCTT